MRRDRTFAMTIVSLLLGLAQDWPAHRGNVARTGTVDGKPGPIHPKVLWVQRSREHFVASLSVSARTGLYVAIFLVVLRILQDYVFYPRIVREGIHMHPLAIILCVLAGEQIAGIPGVFISIPLVALATVIYRHFLEHSGTTGVFAGWLEPKELPVGETKQ